MYVQTLLGTLACILPGCFLVGSFKTQIAEIGHEFRLEAVIASYDARFALSRPTLNTLNLGLVRDSSLTPSNFL